MNDLIDRQAAIDAICEHGTDLERIGITFIAVASHKQVTVDLLEQLPSAQRWIPCNWHTEKESLPQECKSVLVCIKGKSGYQINVSYRADYNRWEGFGRANVIAWMPLPEPYKGEQE